MTSSLATYIALSGNTAEAMEYWHSVFGGDLEIIRYGDMSTEGFPFEPDPNLVAHAKLTMPSGVIVGGDVMDTKEYPIRDTAYSLLFSADSPEEVRELFQKLLDGGGVAGMPLETAPWGDLYGQVFDKFGVMWAFSCSQDA